MYKRMLAAVIVCAVCLICLGESALADIQTVWTQSYSKSASGKLSYEVTLAKVSTGFTMPDNFRSMDDYHTRVNTNGMLLTSETLGGPKYDEGRMVLRVSDQGLIIVGYKRTSASNYNVFIEQKNGKGETVWSRNFSTASDKKFVKKKLYVTGWSLSFSTPTGDAYAMRFAPKQKKEEETQVQGMLVKDFLLHQNYPNPFNPSTTISYSIPDPGLVTLKIYNIRGQEIMTLVDQKQAAGNHKITFDASTLASGFYIYRLSAGKHVDTKKMLFIK